VVCGYYNMVKYIGAPCTATLSAPAINNPLLPAQNPTPVIIQARQLIPPRWLLSRHFMRNFPLARLSLAYMNGLDHRFHPKIRELARALQHAPYRANYWYDTDADLELNSSILMFDLAHTALRQWSKVSAKRDLLSDEKEDLRMFELRLTNAYKRRQPYGYLHLSKLKRHMGYGRRAVLRLMKLMKTYLIDPVRIVGVLPTAYKEFASSVLLRIVEPALQKMAQDMQHYIVSVIAAYHKAPGGTRRIGSNLGKVVASFLYGYGLRQKL
jgi:hypothetical protein